MNALICSVTLINSVHVYMKSVHVTLNKLRRRRNFGVIYPECVTYLITTLVIARDARQVHLVEHQVAMTIPRREVSQQLLQQL